MSVPSSTQPAFWQMLSSHPGQCNQQLLASVWQLDLGPKKEHWDLYATYTQEQLRHEIQSHWEAWKFYRPIASYVPWVWALKVYLWRFPLDTELFSQLRQDMGPFWLMHVRHSDEDWAWLYSVRETIPMNEMALLLGLLPTHPTGEALAVEISPVFDGYEGGEFVNDTTFERLVLSQSAMGILHKYGHVLLHSDAYFYPRWRALLICLYNSLRKIRDQKKKTAGSVSQEILDRACQWIGLTPRTLWKGFDEAWVTFAKSQNCTSLVSWDAYVIEFSRPRNWRERLRDCIKNEEQGTLQTGKALAILV